MPLWPARVVSAKPFMHCTANPQLPRYQVRRVVAISAARTFYDVLGLKESASLEEIRTAFRRLAKEKHPDVSQDDNSEQEFMQLKQAHDTLTDAALRAQYDWALQQGLPPHRAASRRGGGPADGGRSRSIRRPGSGYGNSRSASGFRTRQATSSHDGSRFSRSSSSSAAARPHHHHDQQQQQQQQQQEQAAPTYRTSSPIGIRGRWWPEGWMNSRPSPPNQQSATPRNTVGPSGEDDWSGASAVENRRAVTPGATPRGGATRTVGAWGDDWTPNPRVKKSTKPHTAPARPPVGGDDWGSWAAAARAAGSNVVSSNSMSAGSSDGVPETPAGPVSGDDWNRLYAHVVAPGRPLGTASTSSPAAASSASNEWWSTAAGDLSSRDDLEGYSDVVLTSTPSPSAAVMDSAAAAAVEGFSDIPGKAHTGGGGAGRVAANGGTSDVRAAVSRPATLSRGDDFELYADVVDTLPAVPTTVSSTDVANLKDLSNKQQEAVGSAVAAVTVAQPKGDDFDLLSMVAAVPGDSVTLESDERRRASFAATVPAVPPPSPPPPPPSGPPSGDDFALLAYLAMVKEDA